MYEEPLFCFISHQSWHQNEAERVVRGWKSKEMRGKGLGGHS